MKRIFKGEIEVTTVTSVAIVNVAVVVIVYAAVTLFPWSSMLSVYLKTRASHIVYKFTTPTLLSLPVESISRAQRQRSGPLYIERVAFYV